MKILHVIPAIAPRYGGPSKVVLEMSRALRDLKIQSEIAGTNADGPGVLSVKTGEWTEYGGERCIFFPRDFSEALKYSSAMKKWLASHVVEYDLVHIHSIFSHAPYAAAQACQRAGVPYVLRPLGTLEPWSMAHMPLKKSVAWSLVFSRVAKKAAAIQYTTRAEKEKTEGLLKLCNGHIIPNGLPQEFLNAAKTAHARATNESFTRPYVLFLARIDPKKNLPVLFEAFSRVNVSDCEWVIAGDGEPAYLHHLKQTVENLGIASRVRWTGWVQGQEKIDLLARARVLVLPSSQENFGNSLLEALACGTPVIASPETGIADEIQKTESGWITPTTSNALATAITEALTDTALRDVRGKNGMQWAYENFSWNTIAPQLVALYQQLIAKAALAST